MKALLVAPSIFFRDVGSIREHYHLFYLWSYVRYHCPDADVGVLDLSREIGRPYTVEDVDKFLEVAEYLLRRRDFDLVGISCWSSFHYLSTMAIARLCKRLNPDCTVVVGGYHPSYVPEDFCFPGTPVDFVVKGEGEVVLQRLIAGRVPRDGTPTIVAGEAVDMETQPLLWDEYPYFRNAEAVGMFASRGCPFACSFCLDRLTTRRGFSPQRTIAEIDRVVALFPRLRGVLMYDPLWGADPRWRREFLDLLLARPYHQELAFWTQTRIEIVRRDDVEQLARVPNFHFCMGMESASPMLLKLMQKAHDPAAYLKRFVELADAMDEQGLVHTIFQIYNYPGETTSTLQESLDFWTGFYGSRERSHTIFAESPYQCYPGSDAFVRLAEFEQRFGTRVLHPDWWRRLRSDMRPLHTDILPSAELGEAGAIGRYRDVAHQIGMAMMGKLAPKALARLEWDKEIYRQEVPLQPRDPAYFDRLRLRLDERALLHRKLDGRAVLYSFRDDAHFHCSRETTQLLDALLAEGASVGELAARHAAVYPNAEAYRDKLRRLADDLVAKGMLAYHAGPPAASPAVRRARLRLDTGDVELELYPDTAPLAVASFLHLARAGFYDGLRFFPVQRMAFAAAGIFGPPNAGAGYVLPREESGQPHARGAVALMREGDGVHGSRFMICYEAQPRLDGRQTVFARVRDGMAAVEALQAGDYILGVEISADLPAPTAAGDPGQGP